MAVIGLVGCGRWGRHILRDLESLGCRVHVVARSDESRARATAGGAESIVRACHELPDCEGFVVATPTSSHVRVALELASRGVPVFIEKALSADVRDARALVERMGDRLFVMDKWRYHPGVLALSEIVRNGELGPVEGLRSVRVGWKSHERDVDASWYLASHDLAIALEVLGERPEPRAAIVERDRHGIQGMIGILGESPSVVFEVSERRARNVREVRLLCRDGQAVLGGSYDDALEILRYGGTEAFEPPSPERRPVEGMLPLLAELAAFVGYLRGGPPPKSNAADALWIVETIDRLRILAGAG